MEDSQEKKNVETPVENLQEQTEQDTNNVEKVVFNTTAEVVKRVTELAHGEETPEKAEIDMLKTAFYKLHLAEREVQYKQYIDGGGDPDKYEVTPSEDENIFKAEMTLIREKRAEAMLKNQEEQQANLERKLNIIEQIKAMVTSPEEANKSYKQFRDLQQEWRDIKNVPADKVNSLWRNYQLYVEQFYDLLKLNSAAREYDFKKNLEIKTHLCEAAEKLADEPDAVSAFHQLQKLHQEYRETGPVAKELREEIWERFKAASTVVNKRHQAHFEELKGREEENLQKKTVLCEKVEEIADKEVKNSNEWDKLTKAIIEIQAEWKTIGFAPQKMNVKIFERFRAACDKFFMAKADYFKNLKSTFAENAEKKRALIAKAHELEDSQDWKKTSEEFIQLQKQWKEIGMTTKKLGDALWTEFLAACNKFFEARNANTNSQYKEERENLAQKKDIIKQLKDMLEEKVEKATEDVAALGDQLFAKFNEIGHVPFRDKDKIHKEFTETINNINKQFNLTLGKKNIQNFRNKVKDMVKSGTEAILDERAKLLHQYDTLKSEIQTYENNLGFLNASSKSGNSLIEKMSQKVDKLKEDMQVVYEKIKAIDTERSKAGKQDDTVPDTSAEEDK
ncbi:MAG: DUF349 domain-containing protein [Bacteroidaceae bacterium]|nr:DUF349 domain-containing protein [Bacteroidaceae bacterium]